MKPIISNNIRLRHQDYFSIGDYSVVDDFCYFSTKVTLGIFCHIAPHCVIAGGIQNHFQMGDYSSLSSGVKIYCATNNFSEGLVVLLPKHLQHIDQDKIEGDVILDKYTGIGSNSAIMPHNFIPQGVSIGALSFVPSDYPFEEWTVYAGIPIKKIKKRNKNQVLSRITEIEITLQS